MRVYENKIRISRLYDLPRRMRQPLLGACDAARKWGQAGYGESTVFSVIVNDKRNSGYVAVKGSGVERRLQILLRAELVNSTRSWKIYFGVDHETRPYPDFIDPNFLAASAVDPHLAGYGMVVPVRRVTPRRLYVVPSPDRGYLQEASFEMDALWEAEDLLPKARFVVTQKSGESDVVSDIVGKDRLIMLGSALLAQKGQLEELY
ncbi:MAG: hypothetical protein HY516_02430 [Candidatus Aenigmarchaeota archaeon]|nr:hypothetical protein [Candidatus Aenigmarchaeota archaeon]